MAAKQFESEGYLSVTPLLSLSVSLSLCLSLCRSPWFNMKQTLSDPSYLLWARDQIAQTCPSQWTLCVCVCVYIVCVLGWQLFNESQLYTADWLLPFPIQDMCVYVCLCVCVCVHTGVCPIGNGVPQLKDVTTVWVCVCGCVRACVCSDGLMMFRCAGHTFSAVWDKT